MPLHWSADTNAKYLCVFRLSKPIGIRGHTRHSKRRGDKSHAEWLHGVASKSDDKSESGSNHSIEYVAHPAYADFCPTAPKSLGADNPTVPRAAKSI